jgi:hypothetical protein
LAAALRAASRIASAPFVAADLRPASRSRSGPFVAAALRAASLRLPRSSSATAALPCR